MEGFNPFRAPPPKKGGPGGGGRGRGYGPSGMPGFMGMPQPPSSRGNAPGAGGAAKGKGLLQTINKLEQVSEDRAFELIRLRVSSHPSTGSLLLLVYTNIA